MVTFTAGAHRFGLRVAGLALRGGGAEVLLQGSDREPYWVLPGGRVNLGEPSEQALRREMREELAVEVEPLRLLWVAETFFPDGPGRYHEMGLYYLMQLPDGAPVVQGDGPYYGWDDEMGLRLIFRWFPVAGLDRLPVFPLWLPSSLPSVPDTIQHMVVIEPGG